MNDEIAALIAAAARLPAAERRELIEAIADTLADEACGPLSPELTAELERRVAESDAGIGETVPWETVLAEALARLPHGDHLDRLIESDPAVMLGKPVIRGTRITVELILRKLGAGETMEQIIESHPRLSSEQIRAALAYAAESLARSVAFAESWDRNFEADVREGLLDSLAEEAIEDLKEGRCTDLPAELRDPG
jgi:putative addiction module component (TIGR02574 family)